VLSVNDTCCPACDAQYQQWFGMCSLVAHHGQDCICPKTAPVAPPPSVNEVFTTPPRPTPMPVTRSPATTLCDEMKIAYSVCRIESYQECGDCEKPFTFSEFSSCDRAKDDLCTNNSGCCGWCEKRYLDWINQCTLPELIGADCICENWSPPTDAPTSEPLRIDLNPWPDDFQIAAEPGFYVVSKASLVLPEYQQDVFGIESNVPTTLYYHKKMYLHGHPLHPLHPLHPPFLEQDERCIPGSSNMFANIAVISDCDNLQPDIQVQIDNRREDFEPGERFLKFSITSTEISNNTIFFAPSTFSGQWSCPNGKPVYCAAASTNFSFVWTALLVAVSTAANFVVPFPFLSRNRRIWWGACTALIVWSASTQTTIFSKALSASSAKKMCKVNLEIITNACLGYESFGRQIEISETYESTKSPKADLS